MTKITRQNFGVIVILLIITFLSIMRLNESIWTDEQRTLVYAGAEPHYGQTTITESIARIAKNLWQAPAYYLLLWGWGRLAGWSVFALRLMSVYFGLVTLAVTYRLAQYYFESSVAFYALVTLAFNAFFINFMHDMRAYTLLACVSVWMFYCYHCIAIGKQSLVKYALFTLAISLALYTHYFAIFAIAGLGVCHLVFSYRKSYFLPTLLCFVMGGVLFLPWVSILLNGAELAGEVARSTNNYSFFGGLATIAYFFSNGSEAFLAFLILFGLAENHRKIRFIGLWFAVTYTSLWSITRFYPAFTEIKYVIFFWIALSIIAGIGINHLRKLGINSLLLLALWIGVFFYGQSNQSLQDRIQPFYTPPLNDISANLMPQTQANDVLLFVMPPLKSFVEDAMLSYYFYGDDLLRTAVIRDTFATSDEAFRQQIEEGMQGADRLWITYETRERNWRLGEIETQFLPKHGFISCGVVADTETFFAELYAHQSDNNSTALSFGEDIDSVNVYLLTDDIQHIDNQISLTIGWYIPPEFFGNPYSIAVHIEDETGNLIGQADYGITQPEFDCQHQTIAVSSSNSNQTIVRATVYNWRTGERLPDRSTDTADNRPIMATVTN